MADSTTNLDTISVSQSQKETTDNALADAGSVATYFGRRASTTTALTWGYYGAVIPGSATRIANGTIALTASATNYLYATSAGVVTKATSAPSGWPNALASGAIPLYEIVTGTATVTSYKDWRPGFAGGSGTTYSNFVGDNGGSPNSGVAGLVPAPNQGDSTKYLRGDGTWASVSATVSDFVGDAGSPVGGVHGLVPAPVGGDAVAEKFLFAGGYWKTPRYPSNFVGDAGSPGGGVAGLVPAPASGDSAAGYFLNAGGFWSAPSFSISDFVGDVGSPGGGVHGLVPAPVAGEGSTKFLKADGTWAVPSGLGSSALIVLSPSFNVTQTIDLAAYGGYPIVIVTVGTNTNNSTLNIINGTDGQVIRVRLKPAGFSITQGVAIRVSTSVPWPTSWSSSTLIDRLGFEWHGGDGKADLIAVNQGF